MYVLKNKSTDQLHRRLASVLEQIIRTVDVDELEELRDQKEDIEAELARRKSGATDTDQHNET